MKSYILDTFLLTLLVVCSADLIYLNYVNAWHDPCQLIEVTELAILTILIVVGVIRITIRITKLRRIK